MQKDRNAVSRDPFFGLVIVDHQSVTVKQIYGVFDS